MQGKKPAKPSSSSSIKTIKLKHYTLTIAMLMGKRVGNTNFFGKSYKQGVNMNIVYSTELYQALIKRRRR